MRTRINGPHVPQRQDTDLWSTRQHELATQAAERKVRLRSLDVYRGLMMIVLAFHGFGLAATSTRMLAEFPDSPSWRQIAIHSRHAEWQGWTAWDFAQPSFMLMVGVSMAYSLRKRFGNGDSGLQVLTHVLWRSSLLILLGVFLTSMGEPYTRWEFTQVLSQIGLGYALLYGFYRAGFWTQVVGVAAILAVTLCIYEFYPMSHPLPDAAVGVSSAWQTQELDHVAPIWYKNANAGHQLDVEFLNLFPRLEPFAFNPGGYVTLNFLPSLATMLLGLICGEQLQRRSHGLVKCLILIALGGLAAAAGWALAHYEIVPMIKRLWTPSWALFSGGICIVVLATLYLLIDVLHFSFWTLPIAVVGMNSIAMYLMSMLLSPWATRTLMTHLGDGIFRGELRWGNDTVQLLSESLTAAVTRWEPTTQATCVGLLFWCVCVGLYRKRIFLRI